MTEFWCEVGVSWHGQPYSIVLVDPFIHFLEVENPLLEVVKHAELHCMEEVRLQDVAHDTGNMSKHVESLLNIARCGCGIGCLGVDITDCSI